MHLAFFMPFFPVIYRHLQTGISPLPEIPKTPQMLLPFPTSVRNVKGAKKKPLLIVYTEFYHREKEKGHIRIMIYPFIIILFSNKPLLG
ncbi:hypothetical protein FHS60_000882 [Alloprevotella rava]|uniref:Uncharacterized protein n=1 Tax=Alloprevotella rava TaxID=671218 RepID=A0A7W5UVQ1_9BACT|nr:hypothetical protein [Alloprevotella rava]